MCSFLCQLYLTEISPLLYLMRPRGAKNRLLRMHLTRNWLASKAHRRRSGIRGNKTL